MIYFAQAEGTDLLKIGYTGGDPAKRLGELQTGCPHKLVLVAAIEGSERDESGWHSEFAEERVSGEWFRLTARLTAAICKAVAGERGRPSVTRAELFAFTFDDAGLVAYAGEVVSEKGDVVRIEVYDGLMMAAAGSLILPGELRDVPRNRMRMFNDRDSFLQSLADGLARNQEAIEQRTRDRVAGIIARAQQKRADD